MSGFDAPTNFYRLSACAALRKLGPSLNAGFAAQGFAAMNAIRSAQIVTALLPLLALPTLVQAARPDPKMDACIKAFVASNIEKDRPVTIRRIASFDTPFYLGEREQTIRLNARTKDSGKRIATATCVINGDEIVLNMDGKPALTTKVAQAQTAKAAR
jgi:hypothetical protein